MIVSLLCVCCGGAGCFDESDKPSEVRCARCGRPTCTACESEDINGVAPAPVKAAQKRVKAKMSELDMDQACLRCGHPLKRHAFPPHAKRPKRQCLWGTPRLDGTTYPGEDAICACMAFDPPVDK